jgi:hypothetical protein
MTDEPTPAPAPVFLPADDPPRATGDPTPPATADHDARDTPDDGVDPDDGEATPPDLKALNRKLELRAKGNYRARIAAERDAAELRAKLDRLEGATRTDSERAIDAARREVSDEWSEKYRALQLEHAVVRSAGNRLADPVDALGLLKLDPAEVIADDGTVDDDAIRAAIDDLIRQKPYLAASAARRPAPTTGDQGARRRPESDDLSNAPMDEYIRRTRPAQYRREA